MYGLSTDTTPTFMSKDSSGNVRVMASIPGTTNTYDLGSSSLKWKDFYMAGNASIGGTLAVTGASTLTGAVAVTGDFAVATSKFTVASASGNTVVAGTLGVTGNVAVNTSKFTVAAATGNTVIAGTLMPSVHATQDFGADTTRWGNGYFGGLVGVTGALGVGGAITGSTGLTVNGKLSGTSKVADFNSTTGAVVLPRMTSTQRDALTAEAGMMIYCTSDNEFYGYVGSTWTRLLTSASFFL